IAQDGSGTRIMTEEEAAEMARTHPDAALMPFLEPGLLENLERTAFEKGLENPPEPTTISAKPVALLEDFENAKLASIRQLILAAGLEITVELTIDANGMITGTVSDAEGQKLSLTVDTKKPNYAADKFTFKFLNEGPSKHLANRKIKLSTDDMRRAFYGDEGRKKAAQVYAEQGERGEMAGEKPPLPMPAIGGRRGGPVEGIPMPFVPPSGEKAGTIGFPSTTGKGAGIPGQLKGPSQFPVTPMEIQVSTKQTPGETKKYKVTPTITIEKERLPTPTVPHTISWKKQRVAAGRVGGGLPDLQYKTRTRTAMRAPTPRRRKPKMPWPAKFGIGAGAVTGGLTFWGAWKVSAAAAVTAMHPAAGTTIIATVKIVLGCLGIHYPI
ncbi:hypothetical protein KJ835_03995, partial [Patescibacteria group bacterium]|nr:hypothetical protein [Patescibacteria group bacterium]